MSTETKEIRKATKLPSSKSEAELDSEREKLLAQIDDFDKELEGIAEKHAQELAADSPNGQRLDELEEIRDRFMREHERLDGPRQGYRRAVDPRGPSRSHAGHDGRASEGARTSRWSTR